MKGSILLKCICDETRFDMLELLQKKKELCVNDFVTHLKKDQPLISHHLKTLKQCGIVSSKEDGKKTLYRISSSQLSSLIESITKTSKQIVNLCNCNLC